MIRIDIQLIRTPQAVKSTKYQKTVSAPLESDMKARHMKAVWRRTQLYGIPQDVVFKKIFGA